MQHSPPRQIHVSVPNQRIELLADGHPVFAFPVSTSAYGLGTEEGSLKTPLGRFEITEKIGAGEPLGMVFKGRVPTGEIGSEDQPDDLVETRILWLHGLEPHNANTRSRYIYIHGTNQESRIGTPASHGCVRMRNADIVTLFNAVEVGDEVLIRS